MSMKEAAKKILGGDFRLEFMPWGVDRGDDGGPGG